VPDLSDFSTAEAARLDRERSMSELTWELLTEVSGRLQADLIRSHLEADGIQVELFQESVGVNAYPVTIDGLGRVQLFVPREQLALAQRILAAHEA
jgi:hypothetical protein